MLVLFNINFKRKLPVYHHYKVYTFQNEMNISHFFFLSSCLGSVAGGTLVTITGDGFVSADTRVIVGSIEYTSTASITYTQIQFTTQQPPAAYIDQTIPITILIGTNSAVCSPGPCSYKWAQSVTPILTSISPTSITGPNTLTLTGHNLAAVVSLSASNTHVSIDGQSCTVSSATNSTIVCAVGATEAGNYSVGVSIDGKIFLEYEKKHINFIVFSRCRKCCIITNSYIISNYFKCFTVVW
jgi:hypothetical protein